MTERSPGDPVEPSPETVADLDAQADPAGGLRAGGGVALSDAESPLPCMTDDDYTWCGPEPRC